MIKVGDRKIPLLQLEDPAEPDESMCEWRERLHDAMDSDILKVLSCVLGNAPDWQGRDRVYDIIERHVDVLNDDEFKNLVQEIENA